MNRVYKVIWSKAKHCYVVTSEIARSVTKSASSARSAGRKGAAVLAMAALLFTAGGVLGEAANVTDVTVNKPGNVITVTKEGGDPTPFTIDNVASAVKATQDGDGKEISTTYATKEEVKTDYVQKADAQVIKLTVSGDVEANGNLKVGNGNFTVYGNTGNVTTGNATIGDDLTVKGDTEMKGDLGVKGTLNAADGKFSVGNDGQLSVSSGNFKVDTDGGIYASNGSFKVDTNGGINIGNGTATIDNNGNITGKKLDVGNGDIKGGKITGAELDVSTGDIKGGKITGTGLDVGEGTINTTGTVKAGDVQTGTLKTGGNAEIGGTLKAGTTTVASLDAGSGLIKTTGDISGTNITGTNITGDNVEVKDKLKTKNLVVTDGLEMNHVTLGSKPDNYTEINMGNVTSEVNDTVGAVKYTAESIFNKDGSSITVRTDEGSVDSTGKSIVGAKGISQYLGNNAKPESSDKKVTRNMVRNDDGTFSMEDKAVDGKNKYSTVSQNAGERKVTVIDGTNKASTNLSNNGFNTYASDGKNKTYTKQTATDIKNTAEKGMISHTAKNLVNTASENMTNTVGKDLTTTVGGNKSETVTGTSTETVTGKKTENYNGGLETTVTGDEKHTVNGSQTNAITGSQTNTIGGGQTTTVTGDSSLSAKNITNTATNSITDKVGKNTSWEMTDGTVVESVKDASGKTNQTTTTVADTYQFVKDGDNTLAKRTSSTNDNLNITDGNNTYTKITTATGNKQTVTDGTETASTNLTKSASNTLIENGTQGVLDHMAADTSYTVMNENGNGSRRQQTASEILDRVTDGTDTSEVKQTASEVAASAKDISNTATDKITSQIGEDGKVKSEMNAKGITNTAENGTITNKAQTVNTITGKNKVISENGGTTFENEDAETPFEEGDERGTKDNTKITGNKVETGKVLTDFAEVANNLDVKGSTTLGRDEKTTLTVNSKSTFRDTVKMDKTLAVDGESTFNNKVTITNNGLAVTGGTTTDTLTVTETSEFRGKADFKDNVSMGKGLAVAGETKTGTLHVDHDGYVGGNLNVDGNIETHDAVLSADSRQVVTGRQLYQTNERVDRLDNRIKKVGANAAALAALRPGDFNPDDKFSIAAGFGSYRNANAAALGLFYRPNENVLLSLGTSFGDGENMVNAGVSVKFGRGKSMAERRKEMADEVSSMRDEMRSQDERIAELEEMLKKQSELIEKLSKES